MYTEQELWKRALIERDDFERLYDNWPWPDYPVVTQEKWIPSVDGLLTRVIISRPEGTLGKCLPALVHFHGGGYIRGRADYDERFCRRIVHDVGCVTVNVNYHLAPEYRFPVQPEECGAVLQWVLSHASELGIDETKVAVGGHSAGGNLATVACLIALERKGRLPCCQIIDYGPMSLAGPAPFEGFGPNLELPVERRAAYFNTSYLNGPEELNDWRVSPLCATFLEGMPPALIITAGKDPLTAGAEQYAARLRETGCQVRYSRYEQCAHGFTVMPGLGTDDEIEQAWTEMCEYLSESFW